MMRTHTLTREVIGPWSLVTSTAFWAGFTPNRLAADPGPDALATAFVSEADWTAATAVVTQEGTRARLEVSGSGDLDAASEQVTRFLALDVDASAWPEVGARDGVVGAAQRALPGFRPCGFHSPYEAATWAVLSQRVRVPVAAALRRGIVTSHGEDGAFPSPTALLAALGTGRLTLPGRKAEYLAAVAEAALDGPRLRALPEEAAREEVQRILGIGPFDADLILIRGCNATDWLPRAEPRLEKEVAEQYGAGATLAEVSQAWRPFRSWASVYLRAAREGRLHEMG
ncbi:DNA-3-methyladenine glycosylase family protein [Actinomyces haliotis]|uniref:DNA-3-methyladenine glycosylase family protein n=1 Tax=Actinomyces haliotis TaxID=1280843 RepID=UPI001E32A8C1|nr:hypothetical protein [Actinomyces haliotis]